MTVKLLGRIHNAPGKAYFRYGERQSLCVLVWLLALDAVNRQHREVPVDPPDVGARSCKMKLLAECAAGAVARPALILAQLEYRLKHCWGKRRTRKRYIKLQF
jgi:hypothetical protein